MEEIQVCHDWEHDILTLDPRSKIAAIISRLAKYVITQVQTREEEKVMAIGGDARNRTRT